MLLARKIVQDSKTGNKHEMALIRVATEDGLQERMVPYARWKFLNDSIRAQAPVQWALDELKRMTDSSDPIAFYVSQLAYTEAKMYEKQRIPAFWKELVDVSYEAPPWSDTVEYQTFENVGRGKRIAGNATDIPLVDVKMGRKQIQVESGALGYHYTQHELMASQQLKRPLSDLRMSTVVDGCNRHLNEVALFGEEQFYGLTNCSLVTPVQATTGAWDNASTDPKAILADVNAGITAIYKATGTNDVPTHVAMPIDALAALNNRILTVTAADGSTNVAGGLSVLKYLKENNIAKLTRKVDIEFIGVPGLETAGTKSHAGATTTGKTRVVYYVKNPDRLVMHVPQPLQFLAPQLKNLAVVVPAWYRYAGLELRYPLSMYYQDSVLNGE